MARSAWYARAYQTLSKEVCEKKCLYIIEDPITGLRKIGVSKRPVERIKELRSETGNDLLRFASIAPVDDAYRVETALKQQFVSKKFAHPKLAKSTEWFNGLSRTDLATIMSK